MKLLNYYNFRLEIRRSLLYTLLAPRRLCAYLKSNCIKQYNRVDIAESVRSVLKFPCTSSFSTSTVSKMRALSP